jgi:NADH-quinone oxidoreductase subunit M
MYLTSNSRGGIEASLFFAAWAVLGSILVGLGIMYLTVINNYVFFYQVKLNKLTSNEIYYIYIFFFLGFGVKLSVWPFWYWLPKAHVEVSTGMSIYLSCILIKLSFFCLLRFQFVLLSEIPHLVCVFFSLICCFDITFRFINLKDLKAIIAYGSVLHTNLLLALIHLDSFQIFKASIYYIWGHSLATASLFIIINIIEVNYSSRSILFISGIWNSSPKLFYLIIMSLLSFLDIPVTVFFWGEIWLWIITSNQLWLVFIQVLFLVNVIFTSIFFKIWWCILFGTMDISDKKKSSINLNSELYIQLIILVILQIIFGIQPSILSYITGFYF